MRLVYLFCSDEVYFLTLLFINKTLLIVKTITFWLHIIVNIHVILYCIVKQQLYI